MAKSIAQKSVELAEKNAELLSQLAAVEAKAGEMSAQLNDLAAKLAEMTAAKEAASVNAADLAAKLEQSESVAATVAAERDAAQEKVKELSATLALHPEVKQSAGTAAVDLGEENKGGDQPKSWQEAFKALGYQQARKKHPQLFDAFLKANAKRTNKETER